MAGSTSAPGVQPVTSVNAIDFSSILTAKDADGDTATGAASGAFTIAVENDIPTVSANSTVQLDDDAMPNGNPNGTGDDPN